MEMLGFDSDFSLLGEGQWDGHHNLLSATPQPRTAGSLVTPLRSLMLLNRASLLSGTPYKPIFQRWQGSKSHSWTPDNALDRGGGEKPWNSSVSKMLALGFSHSDAKANRQSHQCLQFSNTWCIYSGLLAAHSTFLWVVGFIQCLPDSVPDKLSPRPRQVAMGMARNLCRNLCRNFLT